MSSKTDEKKPNPKPISKPQPITDSVNSPGQKPEKPEKPRRVIK
jgi:hypothetical protein